MRLQSLGGLGGVIQLCLPLMRLHDGFEDASERLSRIDAERALWHPDAGILAVDSTGLLIDLERPLVAVPAKRAVRA